MSLLRGAICPSAATANALIAYGVRAERIAAVPPGTDKPVSPAPHRVGRSFQLLSVATVTPRKGHLLLIEALADLADLDWHLLCIGSLERDPAAAAACAVRSRDTGSRRA